MKLQAAKKGKKSITKHVAKRSFPSVVIGASAGGLEAVSALFQHLPAEMGMTFFYVQHLSPDHESSLASILSKSTKMKVHEAKDRQKVKIDNIYVCTPNFDMHVNNGTIKLTPRHSDVFPYLPIDDFLSSMAMEYKDNVVGIILSGNGSDGTKGLNAIHQAGGLTFAQDDTAKYPSMPKSSIAAGVVDFVLPPKEIAQALSRFSRDGYVRNDIKSRKLKESLIESIDGDIKYIFALLLKVKGIDFSHYKLSTIKRRLNHRMVQYKKKSLKEYRKLLSKKQIEIDTLCNDLLINVTTFFREPETFRYLETTYLPKLLKNKTEGKTIRIWVPACSSGEEAYSIAMLITELQDKKARKLPVQIFATDLSEHIIHEARVGEYSISDVKSISKKRLGRFFVRIGNMYRISKDLRNMCVFAPHNILRDPPFSRMDFVSCRNLLIYFDAVAQKKALGNLHFALNETGHLLLGKSETIGASPNLFTPIKGKFKIYSRKNNAGLRSVPELAPRIPSAILQDKNLKLHPRRGSLANSTELGKAIDAVLLSRYMPACAIINKEMEILQFRGSTNLFLSHPSGKASLNILKMTRPEFAFELRNTILKALKSKQSIRKSDIEIKIDTAFRMMSVEVSPLKIEWNEPLLLIVFTLQDSVEKESELSGKRSTLSKKDRIIKKLTEELSSKREEMHSIIESHENAFEELQAATEETVSTNEEFQTLNEELETSKEEIEATNEELITTNHELQTRNDQLAEAKDLSEAIVTTLHEPVLILNKNLRIKFANQAFYKVFLMATATTEGKLLYELGNHQWDIPLLRKLLEDIILKNTHVQDYEISHEFKGIGNKTLLLNAKRVVQKVLNEELILIAFTDITERSMQGRVEKKQLQSVIDEQTKSLDESHESLAFKNVALERMNKELETFTYVTSHDLQEPIRKIRNFATVLIQEEQKNLTDTGRDYLVRMKGTVKRMQQLIDDLQSYYRINKGDVIFEKTNLLKIIDEVVTSIKTTLKGKNARIKVEGTGQANVILKQFRQLIQNLISNSLKFAHPKRAPRIGIKIDTVFGDKLKALDLKQEIKYVHITITDNGIGFEPKYKERIFEVLQRLNEHDKYEGSGIGLAYCKRVAENHKGIITATGKPGKSARFDIYLPAL